MEKNEWQGQGENGRSVSVEMEVCKTEKGRGWGGEKEGSERKDSTTATLGDSREGNDGRVGAADGRKEGEVQVQVEVQQQEQQQEQEQEGAGTEVPRYR